MEIKIQIAQEVAVTADEYKQRLCIADLKSPAHDLFDLVEYKGDYSAQKLAVITGFEPRAGGWFYHGRRLGMWGGTETVNFMEKDILRKMEATDGK